jgi:hypothetical protein
MTGSKRSGTPKTLDEICREGIEPLPYRLGLADMVRFLQQYENGSGDYARARHTLAIPGVRITARRVSEKER